MSETSQTASAAPAPARRRDAAATRELLLQAALARFTTEGYASTTVRQVATDAGVNVALIARYFGSKEGLFEDCLRRAADVLGSIASTVGEGESDPQVSGGGQAARIADAIARLSTGVGPDGAPHALLLLLRTSGDAAAEQMRLSVLRGFGERLASASDHADVESRELRAQVLLATSVGIAILRSGEGLEPLASASREELLGPVSDVTSALLGEAGV